MNRNQAIEILQMINEIYPKFNLTERKVEIMLPELEKMDYERVKARFSEYMTTSPFPPTLADIAAYAPPENETLKQMEQWRKEAEQVPAEVKLQFREKMQQLIREKGK